MAVFCAAAIGCGTKTVKNSDTVMEIAEETVVKEEYQMILKSYVARVKGEYTTKEANQKNFWTTKYENGTPLEQIMELAKTDLIEKKVIAQLAKDVGITQETDYISMVEAMNQENTNREEKKTSGNVVYGLTSFEIEEYYSYVYTTVESKLIENLKKNHEISQEELEQIYQDNIEQYTSDICVQMLVAEMQQEIGIKKAEQAAKAMKKETNIETLSKKYPDINFYELRMSSLNMEEGRNASYMQRWLTSSTMQQGEVCEPFEIGENLMVLRCLSRTEDTAEPFEDIKGVLKSEVQTRLAKEDIEKKIQEVEVNFQESVLEEIALEALKK